MIWNLNIAGPGRSPDSEPTERQLPIWIGYITAVALVAAVTGILLLLQKLLPLGQYPITYVLVTMLVAYMFGEGPGILTVFLGLFAFHYFFVSPLHTLIPHSETPTGWAAIIAFVLGTSIVATATAMMRKSTRRIERLLARVQDELSQRLKAEEALSETNDQLVYRSQELDCANEELQVVNEEVAAQNEELRREMDDRRKAEEALKAEQDHKLEFYQRTILAATNGKLAITEHAEIDSNRGRTPCCLGHHQPGSDQDRAARCRRSSSQGRDG